MSFDIYTETGYTQLTPGAYNIIGIGYGGDGAKGGTSPSGNNVTSGDVNGAVGAGGGAGAFVFFKNINVGEYDGYLSFVIDEKSKNLTILGPLVGNVKIPQAGSGVQAPVPATSLTIPPVPGDSVAPANAEYVGSRGGGAGGTYGVRGTSTPAVTPGGKGNNGNGGSAVLPAISGSLRSGGVGGAGGGNTPYTGQGGNGGKGVLDSGLIISESTTLQDIVQAIQGGSGSNGTSPSIRPAQAGISGAYGAGGGGAWTSGTNGGAPSNPAYHVNGGGGAGGIGGIPAVIVVHLTQKVR